MTPTDAANPFHIWADLARGLRDRFLEELKLEDPEVLLSPYTGETLGSLAAFSTRCEHFAAVLYRMRHYNQPAYDAFLRALEKT